MSEFLKMDVFFAVSTASVVVVAVLASVALYYVIRILRKAERLSSDIVAESSLIRADIQELRAGVKLEGFKWKHVARMWRRVLSGPSKRG